MRNFSQELDALPDTLRETFDRDWSELAKTLAQQSSEVTLAVGSGGSLAVAEFLALALGYVLHRAVSVHTPLDLITKPWPIAGRSVWLFSAGAKSPDSQAVFRIIRDHDPSHLSLLTANSRSPLVPEVKNHSHGRVFILPESAQQDGFLATHSLLSGCLAIHQALGLTGRSPKTDRDFLTELQQRLRREARHVLCAPLLSLWERKELLLVHDPLLMPAAVTLETDLAELGLVPVQRVDLRNFAHGRHFGLSRRCAPTAVLAITSPVSLDIWHALSTHLPTEVPRYHLHYDAPAAPDNALLALADVLALIESGANAAGIDARKPGVPAFGKIIYADTTVLEKMPTLPEAVRRKLRRARQHTVTTHAAIDYLNGYRSFLSRLRTTRFSGLVLDYDGTLVAHPKDKVSTQIQALLISLLAHGCCLGFASGRGGSLEEDLRTWIPEMYWPRIWVGYYNGGVVLRLEQSLSEVGLSAVDPDIERAYNVLQAEERIFPHCLEPPKKSPTQIALKITELKHVQEIFGQVKNLLGIHADGPLKVVHSDHSIDVIPRCSTKCSVLKRMKRDSDANSGGEILCIGDSGHEEGNDHELLANTFSLSVDRVSHHAATYWNLLSQGLEGPAGLVSYLLRISLSGNGDYRFIP
uniref:Hydroxymethylpyrimidine pyrophosphatase n=1 Tax=Candidatus Kentrum sp. LPFa TaxID=2126335 RepID=A0A450W297_9GAMM|nr:MAG: Hydroxymethylpyrimidine pyrophosphatase [Candidatus Kentron sp. LPFa]